MGLFQNVRGCYCDRDLFRLPIGTDLESQRDFQYISNFYSLHRSSLPQRTPILIRLPPNCNLFPWGFLALPLKNRVPGIPKRAFWAADCFGSGNGDCYWDLISPINEPRTSPNHLSILQPTLILPSPNSSILCNASNVPFFKIHTI